MKTECGAWPFGIAKYLARLRPVEGDLRPDWTLLHHIHVGKNQGAAFVVRRNLRARGLCAEVVKTFLPHPSKNPEVVQTWQTIPVLYFNGTNYREMSHYQRTMDNMIAMDWATLLGQQTIITPLGCDSYVDGGLTLCIMPVDRKPCIVFGKVIRQTREGGDVWLPSLKRCFIFSERDRALAQMFAAHLRHQIEYIRLEGIDDGRRK